MADFNQPIVVELHDLAGCSVCLRWSQRTVGYGELCLSVRRDGDALLIEGDTECMSREWVRRALIAAANTLSSALPENGVTPVRIPIPKDVLQHGERLES